MSSLSLSARDKTPAPSGYGYNFHHTTPQRRVPCVLGDMLAPRSADDIPPITPEAMAAVQAAITLLANLVGDRDHGIFLGCGDAKLAEYHEKARAILNMGRGLTGILRVVAPQVPVPASTPDATSSTIGVCVQLSAAEVTSLELAHEHARVSMAHPYAWESRDITMQVVGKVLTAARATSPAAFIDRDDVVRGAVSETATAPR